MPRSSAPITAPLARLAAACAAVASLALFTVVATRSAAWIGATFPGFFVLHNRVVPPVSRPNWGAAPFVFQSQITSAGGHPVSTAADVYEAVAKHPPHTHIDYVLRTAAGETISAAVDSRRFSRSDYALTLAAPLLNGLLFIAIGLVVLWMRPERGATWGMVSVCISTGVFALTGAGLDTSDGLFRLHQVAAALMPPAYAHLALVFPTERLGKRRFLWLALLYLPFAVFAVWFTRAAGDPFAYTTAHLTATGLQGVAVLALLARAATHLVGRSSPLARRRVGVAALGAVAGLVLPSAVALASAALGGRVAVNDGMYTAFLFPLSLAYALLTQDLFEIDRMLLRAISCGAVVTTAACVYFGIFFAVGYLMPTHSVSEWPVAHAALDLGLLFAIAPSFDWARRGIGRLYFHRPLDGDRALRAMSRLLVSAHSVEDVAQVAQHTLRDALGANVVLRLRRSDGGFAAVGKGAHGRPPLELAYGLLRRLASGESLARYEWEDGGGAALAALPWSDRNVEVLVPLRRGETLVGLLVLGPKRSGHAFHAGDVALLQASSLPLVMALSAASAVRQLEALNTNLEEQVRARTVAFEETNRELQDSLRRLREAYQVLERNQVGLLRADRLATLGRLTAGLAHEINTPLAAVMNSLKVVIDLAEEYTDSIGDESVLPEDHREISAELLASARAADAWARRAATFLSRTKTHGRELKGGVRDRFAIAGVVEEVKGLLAHRLHGCGCRIEYVEQPARIGLVGDQSRLSQVLVNLISNALDAYEDGGIRGGIVRVAATQHGERIEVQVRDWAGGIPKDVLPHIFDELFTTKAPGRGTGLGLWIVRNLVEEGFDGKILVDSAPGRGSCFTAVLPADGGGGDDQLAGGLAAAAGGAARSAAA